MCKAVVYVHVSENYSCISTFKSSSKPWSFYRFLNCTHLDQWAVILHVEKEAVSGILSSRSASGKNCIVLSKSLAIGTARDIGSKVFSIEMICKASRLQNVPNTFISIKFMIASIDKIEWKHLQDGGQLFSSWVRGIRKACAIHDISIVHKKYISVPLSSLVLNKLPETIEVSIIRIQNGIAIIMLMPGDPRMDVCDHDNVEIRPLEIARDSQTK
mmetsp:Transcript_14738/g.22352  ORF Transcript_14738/g.22352 Transcript_14738/m.22352 type:complete len:215 (-) Transcript_14738:226-870(-)